MHELRRPMVDDVDIGDLRGVLRAQLGILGRLASVLDALSADLHSSLDRLERHLLDRGGAQADAMRGTLEELRRVLLEVRVLAERSGAAAEHVEREVTGRVDLLAVVPPRKPTLWDAIREAGKTRLVAAIIGVAAAFGATLIELIKYCATRVHPGP